MKRGIIGVLLFFIHVLAIVINFNSFQHRSPANIPNSIVSLCYLAFWVWLLSTADRSGEYQEMSVMLVFWSTVFITALLALSIKTFDIDFPMMTPLTLLFLTPAYGIRIIQISDEAALTTIMIIAFFFSCHCFLCRRMHIRR